MPKMYSEQEKAHIIKRLKEEAAKCLCQYGVRKTTVDELVKRVQIPKGTFYLFYPSKEQLLFETLVESHEAVEQHLMQLATHAAQGEMTCEGMTDFILQLYRSANEMPMLKLINSGEIEILARKLPPETLNKHFSQDNDMVELLMQMLPRGSKKNKEAISAAFRIIFLSMISSEQLHDAHSEEGLRLLIRGLVLQIME